MEYFRYDFVSNTAQIEVPRGKTAVLFVNANGSETNLHLSYFGLAANIGGSIQLISVYDNGDYVNVYIGWAGNVRGFFI